MKAIMLAAGLGMRLARGPDASPKVLLRFGGQTLLERHIRILRHCGFSELVLGVGYRAEEIAAEIDRLGAGNFVRTVHNPEFADGVVRTLWSLAPEFDGASDVVLMDGDVLYDRRCMDRLVASPHQNCFLMDRNFEPGDDPVKLCLRDGEIVDFHKRPTAPHDEQGEWIGFVRFDAGMAARLPAAIRPYIESERWEVIYEEPIRDLLWATPGAFGLEDITGLPWIEIDFPEDLARARDEVLGRLEALPA